MSGKRKLAAFCLGLGAVVGLALLGKLGGADAADAIVWLVVAYTGGNAVSALASRVGR